MGLIIQTKEKESVRYCVCVGGGRFVRWCVRVILVNCAPFVKTKVASLGFYMCGVALNAYIFQSSLNPDTWMTLLFCLFSDILRTGRGLNMQFILSEKLVNDIALLDYMIFLLFSNVIQP